MARRARWPVHWLATIRTVGTCPICPEVVFDARKRSSRNGKVVFSCSRRRLDALGWNRGSKSMAGKHCRYLEGNRQSESIDADHHFTRHDWRVQCDLWNARRCSGWPEEYDSGLLLSRKRSIQLPSQDHGDQRYLPGLQWKRILLR